MAAAAVLTVLVPALGLQIYTLRQSWQAAELVAVDRVVLQAQAGADSVAELLSQGQLLLEFLASRPEAIALDRTRCPELFKGVGDVSPVFINVILSAADGQRICSQNVAPGAHAPVKEDDSWFLPAMRAQRFVLSSPRRGQTSNRAIALLSLPVRNANDQKVGTLALSLDLVALSELLRIDHPRGLQSISLVNANSEVLLRHPDPAQHIGKTLPPEAIRMRQGNPEGTFTEPGLDGITRLVASRQIREYGLRFSASIPADEVYAPARATLRTGALVTALTFTLALAVAFWVARRLYAPMAQLLSDTRALTAGNARRVRGDLPGEFDLLSKEFNRLLAVHEEQSLKIKEGARSAERQFRHYQALSATNRAIVRASESLDIFNEVCSICVNYGLAKLAWLALVENGKAYPRAGAGPVEQYTKDLVLDMAPWSLDASSPTVTAIREGQAVVINNFRSDPRTFRWLSRAEPLNIGSACSVPLRRGGKVIGALSLQDEATGHFDTSLVTLLTEMAGDVSFTLDNLDREKARLKAEEKVRQHEQQLAGIIETAMDAIITFDHRERVVLFNQAASQLFGYSREDALGLPLSNFLPKTAISAHKQHFASFARTGSTSRAMGPTQSLVAVRADGSEFPIEASISKLGSGEQLLATVVLRDVTRVREAEAMRQAQIEAQASNQAKTEFLSKMSHELRTPLNAIMGFSRLLGATSSAKLSAQERTQLGAIVSASAQLKSLIDDVLDVSRIEAGTLTVELRPCRVSDLLDSVAAVAQDSAREKGVSLGLNYASREPGFEVLTDPVRLKQVLTNLTSNAIKYNREGGSVFLDALREQGRVVFVVRDTGMGMDSDQVAQLFQPFNRLGRESSGIEGTGIGLALSKDLTQLLGGELSVSSQPGEGTTVTLSFPDRQFEGAAPVAPPPSTPEVDWSKPLDTSLSATICYVEDNPVNAMLVKQLLARLPGVQVLVAVNGKQGIQLVQEHLPDLILLDMQLPDMSGLDVLRALKAEQSTRNLCVVALSASAMSADVEAARAGGVLDYWTKPLDFDHFVENVHAVLEKQTAG